MVKATKQFNFLLVCQSYRLPPMQERLLRLERFGINAIALSLASCAFSVERGYGVGVGDGRRKIRVEELHVRKLNLTIRSC